MNVSVCVIFIYKFFCAAQSIEFLFVSADKMQNS